MRVNTTDVYSLMVFYDTKNETLLYTIETHNLDSITYNDVNYDNNKKKN